jgi:ElaB/YqjD/DUF883 family membrane-anchored ribosome-binding protein
MKPNGHRRPEEIEADIEHTRGDLDRTLSAIEQRLTPGQLFDQGIGYLREHGAREYVSNLNAAAKRDPIPLALVGIGLAWLMQSSRRGNEHEPAALPAESDVGLKQTISNAAHAARERAGRVSSNAQAQAQRVRGGYDRLVNEKPLALGAIGFAVGAVLAALAPHTRAEDELIGSASDRLAERTKDTAREQLDRAKGESATEAVPTSAEPAAYPAFPDTSPRTNE